MDGNGALFGTLSGNTRDVLHKFTVDLPKKHGKTYITYVVIWHAYVCTFFLIQPVIIYWLVEMHFM